MGDGSDRNEKDEKRRLSLEETLGQGSGAATTSSTTTGAASRSSASASTSTADPEPMPPGFPFEAATKETIYPQEDTWFDHEIRRTEVERDLSNDEGIDNLQGRELDDAMVRLANENPEMLKAKILEARARR